MQVVRLMPIPHQSLNVRLDGQYFKLSIYQKGSSIYADAECSGQDVVRFVPCLNLTPILRREYIGTRGNLLFVDTEGADDPYDHSALGTRWQLLYLTDEEFAAIDELVVR